MKKRPLMAIGLLSLAIMAHTQNVGIGTNSPLAKLHVFSTVSTAVLAETNSGSNYAGFEAKTNAGINDNVFVRKWMPGASGTMAGVSLNNLSQVVAGVGAGPLMIGVANNNPLYITTNNAVRMQVSATGNVSINTVPNDYYKLAISGDSYGAIYATSNYIPDISHFAPTIYGGVDVTQLRATGIYGEVRSGGTSAAITGGLYGVLGTSITSGYGIGAFAVEGASGIYTQAPLPGKALVSNGAIQLTGISEGAGKVLTSDAGGNATWQSLAGSHNHFGENWSGTASFGLAVSTDAANGTGLSGLGSTGVSGWSTSASGFGLLGINISSGNYHPIVTNVGTVGVAGDGYGVFAASVSGTSLYAYKANLGSASGMVALFENQKTGLTSPVVKIIGTSAQPALEVNNGFIKVSGTDKTAFTVTTSSGNTVSNNAAITYNNPLSTDIVIVTHNWQGSYIGSIGVYWAGTGWRLFREDINSLPLGEKFNVLVIRQ